MFMSPVRDLSDDEVRYAGRDILADWVTALQEERGKLYDEVKALRAALAEKVSA